MMDTVDARLRNNQIRFELPVLFTRRIMLHWEIKLITKNTSVVAGRRLIGLLDKNKNIAEFKKTNLRLWPTWHPEQKTVESVLEVLELP